MDFQVIGDITDIEVIAVGGGIRIASRLRKRYGAGRSRQLKGIASVRLSDDTVRLRIKRFLD